MKQVQKDAKDRMVKALESLEREFARLRTGRASTALIDHIMVDYYGSPTPINQVGSVAIPDSRCITIQPWDKNAFSMVERAIQKSDLGLNPVNDGTLIRINIPPLTEERRKELSRVARQYAEDAKVAIRNIRRDANDAIKAKEENKEIGQDEQRRGEADIQKLTDDYVKLIDEATDRKEEEIMEI